MSNEQSTRIEIPNELVTKLDEIKKETYGAGKGYGGTIGLLIREHEQSKDIAKVLQDSLNSIPGACEAAVKKSFKAFFKSLFTMGGE